MNAQTNSTMLRFRRWVSTRIATLGLPAPAQTSQAAQDEPMPITDVQAVPAPVSADQAAQERMRAHEADVRATCARYGRQDPGDDEDAVLERLAVLTAERGNPRAAAMRLFGGGRS